MSNPNNSHGVISKRRRGNHSTAVKNPNPIAKTSDRLENRPPFVQDIVKASQTRNITISDVVQLGIAQLKLFGDRKRGIYADCAKAMIALVTVFSEHVNIATHQVEISLRNASDMAGLTTQAEGGKTNISRASRVKDLLVLLGLIRFVREEQVFDGELGMWLDSYYEVTPLFFMALGFTTKRVEREQNKRLGFLKSNALAAGVSAEEVGRMTISHLKELRRHEWRRRAFERRAKEKAKAKFQRMLHEKTRTEQRAIASKRVLSYLSQEQLAGINGPAEFLDLVNREIALMRQVSGVPAPPH